MSQNLTPPFSKENSLFDYDPKAMRLDYDPKTKSRNDLSQQVTAELDVSRLNRVHQHLWLAGLPGNARPLHRQRMMQRALVITEQTDLHLVWWGSCMFVKPLPRFLLDYGFFERNLCSTDIPPKQKYTLHASACGLLHSYAGLIKYESDLKIAVELGLLPPEIEWKGWVAFADEIWVNVDTNAGDQTNLRYHYGELRRVRLNWIYRVACGQWNHGYHHIYTEYGKLFQTNFAWLLLAFAYATIILSAMQVGLATKQGQHDDRLAKVSYGFSVALLSAVVGIVGLIVLAFILLFLHNLTTATLVRHASMREKRKAVAAARKSSFVP